ncbi:Starch-binding associating with outer membrane [Pseudarcicella hirudinis]|uniref:Starch-binding associating with outer membrane n=2 Tax=Pseudarcicella hirudinis TaxID=1079859 RepID=A0A1I5T3D8_9BACT|nr:RagB/SusD family nutrient uptake outer membrane protein [Pseudarcicella hirudinis]SFP77539.1 Starch-binding associating with outer membrane [Pseudarcicella hirudinis]
MTKNIKIIFSVALSAFLISCESVLDKQNLAGVNPQTVSSDVNVANAYINNLYATIMPGNPSGNGNGTDEGVPYEKQFNAILHGTATIEVLDNFKQYENIRSINIFLDNLDAATYAQNSKDQFKGEALFWRAWAYNTLVSSYGGVPLILKAQAPTTDLTVLAQTRNKTSECVTQILKDLDDAIALLPETSDPGRIDKGSAMAFKGRVLLFFASPLFNGLGGVATWKKAYDANLAAKTFLDGKGKGLFSPYKDIWDVELNKEVVMVRRYNYPQATYFQGGLMPLNWSKDDVGYDRPSLELVDAFPMKDGSSWNPGTDGYSKFFMNRDDRFYANIAYNGSPNQYLKGMRDSKSYLWTYWNNITDYNGVKGIIGKHNQVTDEGTLPSASGFYRIKAIDKNIDKGNVYNAAVDWPEIRYTEVLMNLGECANEVGETNTALQVLKDVRNRANISAGTDGNFGILAKTQTEIRIAYQKERFVEFCFEGKRWNDIRRWKLFDQLNALPQRHGLAITLKPGVPDMAPMADLNTNYDNFTYKVITCDPINLALKDQYYIYPIPKARLDRNAKLEQVKGWGGTFDPFL